MLHVREKTALNGGEACTLLRSEPALDMLRRHLPSSVMKKCRPKTSLRGKQPARDVSMDEDPWDTASADSDPWDQAATDTDHWDREDDPRVAGLQSGQSPLSVASGYEDDPSQRFQKPLNPGTALN